MFALEPADAACDRIVDSRTRPTTMTITPMMMLTILPCCIEVYPSFDTRGQRRSAQIIAPHTAISKATIAINSMMNVVVPHSSLTAPAVIGLLISCKVFTWLTPIKTKAKAKGIASTAAGRITQI